MKIESVRIENFRSFKDETIHFLLPYRGYNINDLFGNMAGVILGAMAARWLLPWLINRY